MKCILFLLIVYWVGGEIYGDDVVIDVVSNDICNLGLGSLYVVLCGECFDGYDFVVDVQVCGVSVLLVECLLLVELLQVLVVDSELVLVKIVIGMQCDCSIEVFVIIGSNGKISVKSLLLLILQQVVQYVYKVVYVNLGNCNNEIGLLLVVIDVLEDVDYVVYEMGVGKLGDIVYLIDIVCLCYVLVNNIVFVYLEWMGSLFGVVVIKGVIYVVLLVDGVVVINVDDVYGCWFEQYVVGILVCCCVLCYGLEYLVDVIVCDICVGVQGSQFILVVLIGEVCVVLGLLGCYNVSNVLVVVSLVLVVGVDLVLIVVGLVEVQLVLGCQIVYQLCNGVVLVDDSYNVNFGLLVVVIDVLVVVLEEGWLVLGDMCELGLDGEVLYVQVGICVCVVGLKWLYVLGLFSVVVVVVFGEGGCYFVIYGVLLQVLQDELYVGVCCLVKGFCGSVMDLIVKVLLV